MKPNFNQKEPIIMVVKVTAACSECHKREVFYVDEKKSRNDIAYICKHCGNTTFNVVFQ